MNPNVIMDGSFELFEVYRLIQDKILVNLAHHFPYAKSVPSGSFQYQSKMLAQMGAIEAETANIIRRYMPETAQATKEAIEGAILDSLKTQEPKLHAAAQKGFLRTGSVSPMPAPEQTNAFRAYYNQSINKMNLINTTMLESTREVYRSTVADISNEIAKIQTTLNVEAGAVISGVSSYNKAIKDAVNAMVSTGITGFVDKGGNRWRPEVYAATVIRTTSANAARQAVFERNEQYGNDLYQVSTHDGARPLCYPWQGKVISKSDWSREVEDFEGNKVHVYAQSETSYGEAAGLFGINCGHYPMVFIPGFSSLRGEPQDPEENAKTYEESQKQRALERKVRNEKLKYDVEKARGADEETLRVQRKRVRAASNELDQFCNETGRARRRYREYRPVNAKWPEKGDMPISKAGAVSDVQIPTPPSTPVPASVPETMETITKVAPPSPVRNPYEGVGNGSWGKFADKLPEDVAMEIESELMSGRGNMTTNEYWRSLVEGKVTNPKIEELLNNVIDESERGPIPSVIPTIKELPVIDVDEDWFYQPEPGIDPMDIRKNSIPYVGIERDMELEELLEYDFSTKVTSVKDGVEVELSKLKTIQPFVTQTGVDRAMRDQAGMGNPVKVISYRGDLYLFDGNHRVNAAVLRGQKTIKARVITRVDK